MHRTEHAREVVDRFRTMVEQAGDKLPDEHYDELILLFEAAIDTAVVDKLEKMADTLTALADKVRNEAEFFD
jgi:hypothetical protein